MEFIRDSLGKGNQSIYSSAIDPIQAGSPITAVIGDAMFHVVKKGTPAVWFITCAFRNGDETLLAATAIPEVAAGLFALICPALADGTTMHESTSQDEALALIAALNGQGEPA